VKRWVTPVTSGRAPRAYPSAESRRRTLVRNFILAIACLAGSALMAFGGAHGLY
jgi:hypothetical protein